MARLLIELKLCCHCDKQKQDHDTIIKDKRQRF